MIASICFLLSVIFSLFAHIQGKKVHCRQKTARTVPHQKVLAVFLSLGSDELLQTSGA